MGCCGGNSSRPIKTQQAVIKKQDAPQKTLVKKIMRNDGRQRVENNNKCYKCGYPTMYVNIAGRERIQCSNANCRTIIK